MQKTLIHFGLTVGAILAAGYLLNAMAKGQLGAMAQGLAKEVTSGFGSLNA